MSKTKQTQDMTMKPLDKDAYIVAKDLTAEERASFRLAWAKMNKEQGTFKTLIIVPEHVELQELTSEALTVLRNTCDTILKGRQS